MRRALCLIAIALGATRIGADPGLAIDVGDIRIEQTTVEGYDLWIRKKTGVNSILLTESTADPKKEANSYALRNPRYHAVNGDEQRMLEGAFLPHELRLYSLIDSTAEGHAEFELAFHIFIPRVVIFGYPWSRAGEIEVLDGTFLNIRSFEHPYADYRGAFRDNPFILRVQQIVAETTDEFNADAVEKLSEIASAGGGESLLSSGKDALLESIGDVLADVSGDSLDIVLALDTTQSMNDEMPFLKKRIVPLIESHTERFSAFRVGLLYYRDYHDEYLVKSFPFATETAIIQDMIDAVRVRGGRDMPEAVFEALFESIHAYEWEADNRLIILIGDAPPHPWPRGSVTEQMVFEDARALGITINTIILPE